MKPNPFPGHSAVKPPKGDRGINTCCRTCDVAWRADKHLRSKCWVCGRFGTRVTGTTAWITRATRCPNISDTAPLSQAAVYWSIMAG